MLRPLYRCVLRLHPPAFRERFADEMLSIFDHCLGRPGLGGLGLGRPTALSLFADGLLSLARQWTLRPEFLHDVAPAPAHQPAMDGIPLFLSLNPFRPRAAAVIHGLLLSVAVFSLTCFAIKYSWIQVLHVRIPEVQFERPQWIPPTARQSDPQRGSPASVAQGRAPIPARPESPAAPSPASTAPPRALRPSSGALPGASPRPIAAQKHATPASAAPDSKLRKVTKTSHAPKAQGTTDPVAPVAGVPSAIAEDSKLDATTRHRVIDGAVANLEKYYVYPNVAEKIANALRAHENNGDDSGASDGETFAKLLTAQMQDVSHDQHLKVAYNAIKSSEGVLGSTPEELARYRKDMRRTNCTFEKGAILPHNIGYLKFNSFPDPSLCQPTAAAEMASLNQADAIIFDLRDNQGGSPSMVALMASYLFEHPTHLDDLYNRSEGSTLQSWTLSPVTGNKLANKPAYVLTSASTFSGAEEFGYDLKLLKRATLVGETTAGAAHMVRRHRIDDHFSIGVPDTRPINPISRTDWEGTGVEPDVKVDAGDALETAKKLAAKDLQQE